MVVHFIKEQLRVRTQLPEPGGEPAPEFLFDLSRIFFCDGELERPLFAESDRRVRRSRGHYGIYADPFLHLHLVLPAARPLRP